MSQTIKTASTKNAFGAVLGTVTSIASTIGGVFEAGGGAADMLNNYVGAAAEKQTIAISYDLATYETKLNDTIVAEEGKRLMEMDALFDAQPKARAFHEKAQYRLACALAARRGEPTPDMPASLQAA